MLRKYQTICISGARTYTNAHRCFVTGSPYFRNDTRLRALRFLDHMLVRNCSTLHLLSSIAKLGVLISLKFLLRRLFTMHFYGLPWKETTAVLRHAACNESNQCVLAQLDGSVDCLYRLACVHIETLVTKSFIDCFTPYSCSVRLT